MHWVGNRRVGNGWIGAMAIALALLITSAWAQQDPTPAPPSPEFRSVVGETKILIPNIVVLTEGGEALSADNVDAVLLHYVDCESTLCGESLQAIDEFIARPLADQPLRVIGIAVGDTGDEAKQRAQSLNLSYPLLGDPNRQAFRLVADEGVPRTVVLDGEGRIAYQFPGFSSGREAEFRYVLEKILEGEEVPPHLQESGGPGDMMGGGGSSDAEVSPILYAKDIRGKEAPAVPVEEWINAVGSTEGKYLMVDFWATWCGPCVQTLRISEQQHHLFEDQLATMAISDEDPATVRRFVQQSGMKQPIGVDTQARAKSELLIKAIPHAFVANPEGKVVWQGHPIELWQNGAARLKEILNGKEFIGE